MRTDRQKKIERGERIKAARTAAGIGSQEELAGRINAWLGDAVTSRSSVANWEAGRTDPDPDMLNALADVTGQSVDYLTGRLSAVAYRADIGGAGSPVCEAHTPAAYGRSAALAEVLRQMFHAKRLASTAQVLIFTNGVLTGEEIEQLAAGMTPSALDEARMAAFLQKFPLDLIKAYYQAAQLPLPARFHDIEADLAEFVERVYGSTDGSPEALEAMLQLARQHWEQRREQQHKDGR